MAHKTIDPDLKKKIIRYLKDHSQCSTAKKFKISPSTVNGIANDPAVKGTIRECSEPKRATAAHKAYAKADRLQVLNKFMGLVDQAMDGDISTGDLRNISTALGTALDKYRLEEKDMDDTSKGDASDLLNQMKKGDAGTK
jgi:hypothetical protein